MTWSQGLEPESLSGMERKVDLAATLPGENRKSVDCGLLPSVLVLCPVSIEE